MPAFSDKVLTKRLTELAARARGRGIAVVTRFLTAGEAALAMGLGEKEGVCATLFGGYDGAERVRCCYHLTDVPPRFPLSIIQARWDERQGPLAHPDLLGAVLSLGIARELIGDILVESGRAYVIATPEIGALITQSLLTAGHAAIACEQVDAVGRIAPEEGKLINDTVASLRLDNVLAAGLNVSRGKAVDAIRAKRVSINHTLCEQADKAVRPGDILSIRGFGRIRITHAASPTRKGRFPITLALFTKK